MSKRSFKIGKDIGDVLTRNGQTLALAESCTGGLISSAITDVPGSSKYFVGGIVAYDNSVKVKVLNVPAKEIKKHGAVSPFVAEQMAKGVKRLLKTDLGAAVTGIAGPGGATKSKPVGLAYISLAGRGFIVTKELVLKGDRMALKNEFAFQLLKLIFLSVKRSGRSKHDGA